MLQDYEISKLEVKEGKWLLFVEFILILIILHLTVMLFFESVEEEESIRFRLLAHSNASEDQAIKRAVQEEITPIIQKVLTTSETVDEIDRNFESARAEMLKVANLVAKDVPITLERKNALFPPKKLGGVIQPQANYHAYILTIGSGRGDNWWCSLFPSVCFQDEQEETEGKVTFFIWEWLKDLFS